MNVKKDDIILSSFLLVVLLIIIKTVTIIYDPLTMGFLAILFFVIVFTIALK